MTKDENGSLVIPVPPPNEAAYTAIHEKLRGRATSDRWLVEGLSPELDGLRTDHLRVRGQVQQELDALAALDSGYAEEDAAHTAELLQAQREGRQPNKDERTPPDKRDANRSGVVERMWASIIVLGEVVDETFAYLNEAAPQLLDELRDRLAPATEKKREAERLLEQARTEEWHVAQQAMWIRQATGHRTHGAQPAPEPTLPPKQFSEAQLERALKMPFREREDREEAMTSWQETAQEAGDATGIVQPLDPEIAGVES